MPKAQRLKFLVLDNPKAPFISNARFSFEDSPVMAQYAKTIRLENPLSSDGLFFNLETSASGDATISLCRDDSGTNLRDFLRKPVMAYEVFSHRDPNQRVYAERRFVPDTKWVLTRNGLVMGQLGWVEDGSDEIQYFPSAASANARFERFQGVGL